MQEAAAHFVGEHDFRNFCASDQNWLAANIQPINLNFMVGSSQRLSDLHRQPSKQCDTLTFLHREPQDLASWKQRLKKRCDYLSVKLQVRWMSRTSQTTAVECSRCRCALSAREWQSLRSLALPSCGTRHLPKSWLGPQNSIVLILDTYEILVSPIQRSFIKFLFHFIFQQQGPFSSRNFLPNLTQKALGNRLWDVWTCFSGCSLRATRLQPSRSGEPLPIPRQSISRMCNLGVRSAW